MPGAPRTASTSLLDDVRLRWHEADPLLPAPAAPAPDDSCGVLLTVTAADGQPLAAAACEHWHATRSRWS